MLYCLKMSYNRIRKTKASSSETATTFALCVIRWSHTHELTYSNYTRYSNTQILKHNFCIRSEFGHMLARMLNCKTNTYIKPLHTQHTHIFRFSHTQMITYSWVSRILPCYCNNHGCSIKTIHNFSTSTGSTVCLPAWLIDSSTFYFLVSQSQKEKNSNTEGQL
jgi:hypothetical protein